MRLLFFSSIFPRPDNPTRGIFCLHLCRALSAAGHDVHVVSPRCWWEKRGEARSTPAELTELSVEYPRYAYPPRMLRAEHHWFMRRFVGRATRRAIEQFKPDVMLAHWTHPDGAVAARIAREVKIPSVIKVGGSDVLILPKRGRRCRRAVVAALGMADAVVAIGNDLRDRVVELGIDPGKVHVVYQGVAPEFSPGDRELARRRLSLQDADPILLWVGRMVAVKALDVLLDACDILRDRRQRFRLHLVGDGSLRSTLEADVVARGLSGSVRFVGIVPHRELPDWYRAADLTVLPSHSEGIPNVLRESLACGTPFVATRVGGIPELVNGHHCPLVPPGDAHALADAIGAMLSRRGITLPPAHHRTWDDSAAALLRVIGPLVTSR